VRDLRHSKVPSIGCPPVGVWRGLQRILSLPADAAEHLQRAHRAANKQIRRDGDERNRSVGRLLPRAGRHGYRARGRYQVAMRAPSDLGRYGDAVQPRPFGVETLGASTQSADVRKWTVESVRHVWSIERPQVQARRFDWRSQVAEPAQPASPRTRVNNCTVLSSGHFVADTRAEPLSHRLKALPHPRALVQPGQAS
jgi:hypothetical protein